MATKQELISGVQMVIQEAHRLSRDVSDAQWAEVVDIDGWKNQQVLAHIAGVGGIMVPLGQQLLGGQMAPISMQMVDSFNAGMVSERAGKTPKELAAEVETSYAGIIKFLESAPDESLKQIVSVGGYKDIPFSDVLVRMVVLHGLAHIYSVYSGIFSRSMS